MRGPNMSYCMCENTLAAMRQILDAMREEGPKFLQEMNRSEARAFQELFHACDDFMLLGEQLIDEMDNDPDVDEQTEWRDFDPDC